MKTNETPVGGCGKFILGVTIEADNSVHFQVNIFKNEQFLMSSFEMASCYIFPTYQIVLKLSKTDLSKIQNTVFSKVNMCNFSEA